MRSGGANVVGRSGLAGVFVGLAATALAFWLLFFVGGPAIFPYLYPEGATPVGAASYVQIVLAALLLLASLLATFFLGGLAAGAVTPVSPGRNGVLGAFLSAFGGFAWFAWPLLPLLWEPAGAHAEVYVLNEGLGTLVAAVTVFCALLPFAVVAGYLGGKAGGGLRDGLRRRRAGRSAE